MEVLSRRSIREKLLCYFSIHAKNGTYTMPFTLSALADYIGSDRSAMMRELKKLRQEGLVQVEGRRVTLAPQRQAGVNSLSGQKAGIPTESGPGFSARLAHAACHPGGPRCSHMAQMAEDRSENRLCFSSRHDTIHSIMRQSGKGLCGGRDSSGEERKGYVSNRQKAGAQPHRHHDGN